ncbi:hypothetical protein RAB80_014505 [Fusarium oxysporum f. sp. vasinfectum]|nr:hypothetical protein RAB80_014505 [Fusarium oxysporum f. sp. vasinfectum]
MFSVLNIILNFDQIRRLQARLIELTVGRHVNLKTVNSLTVLVLCWFYVLPGRLFEMQRRRIGYTERRLWPVAPKGETEATATGDINLGNASRTEPLKTTTRPQTSETELIDRNSYCYYCVPRPGCFCFTTVAVKKVIDDSIPKSWREARKAYNYEMW